MTAGGLWGVRVRCGDDDVYPVASRQSAQECADIIEAWWAGFAAEHTVLPPLTAVAVPWPFSAAAHAEARRAADTRRRRDDSGRT